MILGQTLGEEGLNSHPQGVELHGASKGLRLNKVGTELWFVKESLEAFKDCAKPSGGERLTGAADKQRVHEKSPR
jgi:hypothetical protein